MAEAHPDVVATNKWLEDNYQIDVFLARLELAASEVKKADDQVRQATAAVREAEEKLEDRISEIAYPVNMNSDYKNASQRDAEIAKLLRSDHDYPKLRRAVEAAKQQQDAARSEFRRRENHEKNLRAKAEVVAARLRAIAR